MCGIAGIFAYHYAATPVDRDELRTIRDHMAARGPDGKGEWFADNNRVALGHRRLAIIDLSDRAAQPMASVDGQLVISFNGEIYNYRELKKDLEARGRVFRTESDTEVLLHLYAEKGEAMLHDLRGMFAFALWDARKQSMLLARDPYGIKPLYYADDGWTCHFASQVKALLVSDKVSRLPEPAGLAGFYLFGSVPEPYTLYQEIRSVPAGSYQWVDATGPSHPVQYFSIAQAWAEGEQTRPLDPAELQECVREAVLDSVRHHMVADVPVGAFLSAGIDSGALVGLMAEASAPPVHSSQPTANSVHSSPFTAHPAAPRLRTLTLAFAEFRNTHADEAPLAEMVARHYGVDRTTRIVGEQEFRDDLPNILAAMDQPSIDGINTWFVSKAASEAGLKVAVSGVGGDELFGGYPSFRDIPKWVRLLWLPSHLPGLGVLAEQVQAAFSPLFPRINPKASGMLRYGGTYPGAYLLRRGLFLPRELPDLIGKDLAHEGLRRLAPLQHISSQLTAHSSQSPVHSSPFTAHSRVATLESALYMRNQLLRDTDWASMAHSLEIRTPLVDATLLRKLAGPLATATSNNHKQLLAKCPAKPLPDEIANRAKSGFTTPISDWQQRGDTTQSWRKVPALVRKDCPWARRWSYTVSTQGQG
jgi:asparagine synthase (glutamine-hydrolysing)